MIPHSKTHIDNKDIESIKSSLLSGNTSSGDLCLKLANKISNYFEKEFTSIHSSGASALFYILKALDIKNGDSVLIPNYICSSVQSAVLLTGADVVLYDNLPNSWISSASMIEKAKNTKCRAVVINHTFGIRFKQYEDLEKLNLPIIEDCCHAFSPKINGKEIGTRSIASFYSFNSTKFIAGGEGGAIVTNDRNLFKEITNVKIEPGMSDLSASLVLSQMSKVDFFINRRREIAEYYFERLSNISDTLNTYDSLFFRFPIFTENQIFFLSSKRVIFRIGVDQLLSERVLRTSGSFENSIFAKKNTISIPIYPSLEIRDLEIIIEEVKKLWG